MNDEQNKYTINSSLTIQSSATGLKIVMSGDILHTDCSTFLEDLKKYFIKKPKQVVFIAEHLREWDSSLLVVIF